ncbi:MAG: DUF4974 domain-containing protein [Carboxylicivirga sp.]|jgi:ferric-dicitrate binding protein FerR (iron transport regulator)|nr:DUF4974 domain-containing protein [Carboxylicivirga sp.]
MTNKEYNHQLIVRYLSGEASNEERMELKELLANDESLKSHFIEVRDLWNLSNAKQFDAGKAFGDFQHRIKDSENHPIKKLNRYSWLKYVAAAASVLIVLMVGKMRLSPDVEELKSYSYATEKGQRKIIVLPDSTKIWLGSETVLSYTSDFKTKSREVRLSGEAFFDVTHQADKPFVVVSGQHHVKVLGTRFKLNAIKNSPFVETVLEEGKVQVYVPGKDLNCILEPGQKSVFNKIEESLKSSTEPNICVYTAITKGQLVFKNEPLGALSKRLEKWYGVEIVVDESVEKLRFTGVIDQESLEDILKIMAMSNGIHYKETKGTIQITQN